MIEGFVESVRYLCPVCQREWTGAKGSPCEDCYAVGWDTLMVEACKGQRGPLRAPLGSACATEDCPNPAPASGEYCDTCAPVLCAGKGCLERVKEEDDRCPSCEAAYNEYLHDRAEELAYQTARDDYYMRKIDERRGK